MSTAITPNLNSISLYHKDNEYHLDIVGDETKGFTLQYRQGKKGSDLKIKEKNKLPMDFFAAKQVFDGMVANKLKDGWAAIEGTPIDIRKDSGILPQLFGEINEDRAYQLLMADDWILHEMVEGERLLIRWEGKGSKVEGIDVNGKLVEVPKFLNDRIRNVGVRLVVDGILVGERYKMFDLLSVGAHAIAPMQYEHRLEEIESWIANDFDAVEFSGLPWASSTHDKVTLWDGAMAHRAKSAMFTKTSSIYKPGLNEVEPDRVTFKFEY